MDKNIYFANKESKDKGSILLDKAHHWVNNVETSGYLDKLKSMWAAYHGAYYSSAGNAHQVQFSGEQGELVNFPVNHLRNIAEHMLIMTTSNRPSMEARAINTDLKSLSQTYLANGILDYYMREKKLEKYLKRAVEYAIVMGSGYVRLEWNSTAGEIYDTIENEDGTSIPLYDGDLEFSNLSPFDVVVDGTKEHQDHDWILIRTYKNKFDLAAKYPEIEDKILQLPTKSDLERFTLGLTNLNEETDDVYVYEFFHKKTAAVPNGNYFMFLSPEVTLHDGPLPYRNIPVFRISPADILGTPYGYSTLFDLLPLQEGLNTLYSSILTNQSAFAVQNIFFKRGSGFNIESISGGMNVVEGDEPPVPLQLTSSPKEVFDFLQMIVQAMETISGVNSVSRGNADSLGSNPSGTALALIQSMALQFMSGLQQSYVQLIEDVGTALIKILQDYAESPRLVAIAGKTNKTLMKEFTGQDIGGITRVVVDVGNPLSRTTAGRVQMASELLQYGKDGNQITPDQYITLINTGKLDVMTEDIVHEQFSLRDENEALMNGEIPFVTFMDDHRKHILFHKAVLSDPALRKDPDLVQRVRIHVQEHIDELRNTDPDLLMMLGQQPLMPPGMTPEMMGGMPPQMAPMEQPDVGQSGLDMSGQTLTGPGIEGGQRIPGPPSVDPNLLHNPELEPLAQG